MVTIQNSHIVFAVLFVLVGASIAISLDTRYSDEDVQINANVQNIEELRKDVDRIQSDMVPMQSHLGEHGSKIELNKQTLADEITARIDKDFEIKDEIADLKRTIDERTTNTNNRPSGLDDFRLELNRSPIRIGDNFLLEGIDKPNTTVDAVLSCPGDKQQTAHFESHGNGEFWTNFSIPSNWTPGICTISVYIGENFDKINFELEQ